MTITTVMFSHIYYRHSWHLSCKFTASPHQIQPDDAARECDLTTARGDSIKTAMVGMPVVPAVTVCLLYHGIFLFSFLRRTHLLFGMFSYDWVHSLILLSPLNSSFIEL